MKQAQGLSDATSTSLIDSRPDRQPRLPRPQRPATEFATTSTARLAADGGEPVRSKPMPRWPSFDADDIGAAAEVLSSGRVNYWTGEQGACFEKEFAHWIGSPYAVALSNGTIALEAALHSLGLPHDSEVIIPAATFIATASAVVRSGLRPVVVDVATDSLCLTDKSVQPSITSRTAALVVVHLAGFPAEMAPLLKLARQHGLRVIEDCAQAHGARRSGRSVGTFGDIGTWSFCQDKIMTTAGEGGAITTADERLRQRCWQFKDHGKSYASVTERTREAGFRWLHESFGTNGRMTEVQAAIGRRQLVKLDKWVEIRRRNADTLRGGLADLQVLQMPVVPLDGEHAYYRFYVRVRPEYLAPGWDRHRVVAAILAEGIPCAYGGCAEIYRERAFDGMARPRHPLPVAAELGRTSITLPVHPTLGERDVADVVAAVRKVCAAATT